MVSRSYFILFTTFFIFHTQASEENLKSNLEIKEENLGQKISMSVPQLSEEESNSNHMPSNLKCDACLAIVFQMYTTISKEQSKLNEVGKGRKLKEYEIIDVIEEVCIRGFNGYGVKQVESVNRLSGPGLDTEKFMGMTQMGGRWPHRLQEMCHYYVGEAGELSIYKMAIEGRDKLADFMCYGKGIYGHCKHLKPPIKTEL